jgi:hypothetical protein
MLGHMPECRSEISISELITPACLLSISLRQLAMAPTEVTIV